MSSASSVVTHLPSLNAILDFDAATRAGWTLVDLAAAYLEGGARFLQVRAKGRSSGELLDLAGTVVERAAGSGAIVLVNDRADVAVMAGADGVHVGQDDLAPAAARQIVGPQGVVGVSTHTTAQIAAAVVEPVDYLAIGPVFSTQTKATGYDAVGFERVREASRQSAPHRLPVVAIGGITLETARDVIRAGASSVAIISDLLTGDDPAARVRAYLAALAEP